MKIRDLPVRLRTLIRQYRNTQIILANKGAYDPDDWDDIIDSAILAEHKLVQWILNNAQAQRVGQPK